MPQPNQNPQIPPPPPGAQLSPRQPDRPVMPPPPPGAVPKAPATGTYGGVQTPRLDAHQTRPFTTSPPRETFSQFLSGINERVAGWMHLWGRATPEAAGFQALGLEHPIAALGTLIQSETVGQDPQTSGDVVARSAGQMVGDTVPMVAGIYIGGAAIPTTSYAWGAGARSGVVAQGLNNLDMAVLEASRRTFFPATARAMRQIAAGAAMNPYATASGEALGAIGAGAAGGAAQYFAPGNEYAQMGAETLGGMSPIAVAYTPTGIVIRAGSRLIAGFHGTGAHRAAQREVWKVVGNLSPEEMQMLEYALRLQDEIQGFAPSMAEATRAPSLLATQGAIESLASGPDLERLVSRRNANTDAIDQFAAERMPNAANQPSVVVDTATGRVNDVRADIEARQADIAAERMDLADSLPDVDRYSLGDSLRGRYSEIRTGVREELDKLAQDLQLNDYTTLMTIVEYDDFRNVVLEDFTDRFLFKEAPPEVIQIVDDIPDQVAARARSEGAEKGLEGDALDAYVEGNSHMAFGDLKNLRERISDDLMDALSDQGPGTRAKQRNLSLLLRKVDEYLDSDDVVNLLPPELAHKWQFFRREYFNRYIEPFEQGVAFNVREKDRRGFYRTRNEQLVWAYMENPSSARQFLLTFGDDAAAKELATSVALDDIRLKTVGDDGLINERKFNRWVQDHYYLREAFPEIARMTDDIGSVNGALASRQAQLDIRQKRVNDTLLARRLDAWKRSGQSSEDFIGEALNKPELMKSLVRSLEEGSLESLRRHVWDHAMNMDPSSLRRFLDVHGPDVLEPGQPPRVLTERVNTLEMVFDPEHLKDIRKILNAREMNEALGMPEGRGYAPDVLRNFEQYTGMGPMALQSRLLHAHAGRLSFKIVAGDAFARWYRGLRKRQSESLLREALYNPEVARDIASMVGTEGAMPVETGRRLNAWLFWIGQSHEEDEAPAPQPEWLAPRPPSATPGPVQTRRGPVQQTIDQRPLQPLPGDN